MEEQKTQNADFFTETQKEEKESILFRNIDANVDKFLIGLEKHIQKLPNTLKFIEKYIYFTFLPHLDNAIDDLEKIKETPNFDEQIIFVRPMTIKKLQDKNITCIDLLQNHNIKHSKMNKFIFGTYKGEICIFDMDNDKIMSETQVSNSNNRVDSIATSSTKYFDTYITRIVVNCRSEVFIYVYAYNHSFSQMNLECIINTVNPEISDPIVNDNMSLNLLINNIKLSKDGFFLSAIDYEGGVRLYKFNDLPLAQSNTSTIQTENEEKKEEKKDDKKDDKKKNDNSNMNNKYTFINRIISNETENFTILPKEAVSNENASDKKKNNNKKDDKKKDDKKDIKKGKNDKDKNNNEPDKIDETLYNIKTEIDEEKGDLSLYQKYDKNHPFVHFIQKKYITEDKNSSGYSSTTITIGIYIAFSNSTCFKYISFFPYLTDKMKAIFKVQKVKTGIALSIEDTMNLNSSMQKKERDYLNYIRTILNPKNPNNLNIENEKKELENKEKEDKNKKEEKKDNKKGKNDKKEEIEKPKEKPLVNPMSPIDLFDITKNEMSFTTLFNISTMSGQTYINKENNLLALGMIDGGILVWDCELHTDKFLLQKNSRFEITSISISENYLTCGSIVGQIYIYELINGKELFHCMHNPYETLPVQLVLPVFPFIVFSFDSMGKICVYNTKEQKKIGKLLLNTETDKTNYKISYSNKYLIEYNKDYIFIVCEKSDVFYPKKSLLDLINFQDIRTEFLRHKPNSPTTDFFNIMQIESNPKPKPIEEDNKLLTTSNLNEEMKNEKEEEKKEDKNNKSKKEDKNKKNEKDNKKKGKNEPEEEETKENLPEPITKIELQDRVIIIYRIRDILFKCYPNLVFSYKKGLSLVKILKKYNSDEFPTFDKMTSEFSSNLNNTNKKNISELSKNLRSSPKNASSPDRLSNDSPEDTKENTMKLKLNLMGINTNTNNLESIEKVKKESSTQQKDVFYHAFKNIRDRYQYKEIRDNNIQKRKDNIMRELNRKKNKK